MAEQFLTLMADLDNASQAIMSEWYKDLYDAGFRGIQAPDLPFISASGPFGSIWVDAFILPDSIAFVYPLFLVDRGSTNSHCRWARL